MESRQLNPNRPTCPFCDGEQVERVSQWGGQMITSQWRCTGCGTYFEAIRATFDHSPGAPGRSPER